MSTITKVQGFRTNGIPTEEDVQIAVEYANDNQCWVKIEYEYYGYPYTWRIPPNFTFDEVWESRIKVYGV